MTQTEIFRVNFNKDFGILDSTINHIHGVMQAEHSLEGDEELNEYFFQTPLKRALRRKTESIISTAKVLDNKAFVGFPDALAKYTSASKNPQFDAQIKTSSDKLLAAIELKSVFGIGTSKKEVFNDFARLAITNFLFPDSVSVFIIVGNKRELIKFYTDNNFPFANNLRKTKNIDRSWSLINVGELYPLENVYKKILGDLNISKIRVKLSRTQSTSKYHCMSYLVKVDNSRYRSLADFEPCNWGDISPGDIVFEGGIKPPNEISKYRLVDQLSLKLSQVMYQTNEVDDQEWEEINPESVVWRFVPNKL